VKPETNEAEIATDVSSQTRTNTQVNGHWSVFGPPRVRGSGFWTDLASNQSVLAVQIRTAGGLAGPVADSLHSPARVAMVLVLVVTSWMCACAYFAL